MILPIGHTESATRRLPWVTIGIMLSCVLVFLATDDAGFDTAPDRDTMMEDASGYWRDHAYLDAAPEVRTHVAYDVMPNQRSQYLALLVDESMPGQPDSLTELLAEQAELDRLTRYALGDGLPPEAAAAAANNPFTRWGFVPATFSVLALLTHLFMHAGWAHLLSNLFMLFLAGPPVEDRLGRPIFAGFYVSAGIFAALFWAMLTPDPEVALVGASGAISGVLGAFFIRFWDTNIRFGYFYMVAFRPYMGTFEAPAWAMLPLWFANELLQAYVAHSFGVSGGVAYWAHIGGFLFGAGCVYAVKHFGLEEKYIDGRIEAKVTLAEVDPRVQEAMDAQEAGDFAASLDILETAFADAPGDRDVALALWDAARGADAPERGLAGMLAVIRMCANDEDKGLALTHWSELNRALPTALAEPGSLIRLVPALREEGNAELAVTLLRHAVDPENRGLTPGLALRAAELGREIDPPSALRAARVALQSPDLHEEKRARIQAGIDALLAEGVTEAPSAREAYAEAQAAAADRGIAIDEDEAVYAPLPAAVPAATPPPLDDSLDVFDRSRPELNETEEPLDLSPPPLPDPALEDESALAGDVDALTLSPPPLPEPEDDAPLELDPMPEPLAEAMPEASLEPEPELELEPELEPEPKPELEPEPELSPATERAVGGSSQPSPEPLRVPSSEPLDIGEPLEPSAYADDLVAELVTGPRFSSAKVVEAVPTAFADGGLRIRVAGDRVARVTWSQISGVATAVVKGLAQKPVLLIDLLLNWSDLDAQTLQVIRIRSDAFDPRKLDSESADAKTALEGMVARVLEETGATPLPDRAAASGKPYATFEDLAGYEFEVLQIGA